MKMMFMVILRLENSEALHHCVGLYTIINKTEYLDETLRHSYKIFSFGYFTMISCE